MLAAQRDSSRERAFSKTYPNDDGLFAEAAEAGAEIAAAYDGCDYNRAMRLIMALADRANKYVEEREPWNLRKEPSRAAELQSVCTVALNLFRQLAIYLAPVLPRLARQTGELLNSPIERWEDARTPLVGNKVSRFEHLMQRVEPEQVAKMIAASREEAPSASAAPSGGATPSAAAPARPGAGSQTRPAPATDASDGPDALAAEPLAATISFDEFAKVDLRVARVIAAEESSQEQEASSPDIKLRGDERRNVFAGH